jgi:outer membrane protein insertion porin family
VAGSIAPVEGRRIPVTERYFMGGMGSLRGFEYRKVGPLDEDGQPLGGVKEVQFTLEATYPLVVEPNIKGVLFFDAGNVWGEGEQVDLGGLRCGAGFGFRWLSPMGPLRLEWGTNLDPRPGERQPGWEFTIGTSF